MSRSRVIDMERAPIPFFRKVQWTDEEWTIIGDAAWDEHKKSPDAHPVELIRRAQERLPEDRRRIIRTLNGMERIFEQMRAKHDEITALREQTRQLSIKVDQLEAQVQRNLSPEQVIQLLNDDEVLMHFSEKVLRLTPLNELLARFSVADLLASVATPELVGAATQRVMEHWLLKPMTPIAEPGLGPVLAQVTQSNGIIAKDNRPIITLFGLLDSQASQLRKVIGERAVLNIMPKRTCSVDQIPRNTQWMIVWINFTSHAHAGCARSFQKARGLPNERLVRHRDGLTRLTEIVLSIINGAYSA